MPDQSIAGSFAASIAFHLDDCQARGYSPRTIEGKVSALKCFEVWCLSKGLKRPDQLDRHLLDAYLRYLRSYRQPSNQQPLDMATVRNKLTGVKIYLDRLYYHELIPVNPADRFELPKKPRRLPKGYLTVDEVEQLLKHTLIYGNLGLRDRAILEVYYATGIRRMELANLEIGDIDLYREVLRVTQGKGLQDRNVPIAERACQWVAIYLKKVRPLLSRLKSGKTLFLDNKGLKFREHQLSRIASKYVRRAGIKKPGACNLFRHSTATLMHENGADLLYVKEMLGHADISTTQVYTHIAINKLREVYASTHPAAQSGRLQL